MNKELIEKLKDKDKAKALGRHTDEARGVFKKVGPKNCLAYGILGWQETTQFSTNCEYVLKPDYQPKPVDLEIIRIKNRLVVSGENHYKIIGDYGFVPIHELPSLPNFEGFIRKAEGMIEEKWYIQGVAKQISQGHKVYARFRA